MREIFQRHLPPLGEETYQVRECRISRAHYLKATCRILRYTLRLEESATGRERIELLTGVMYAEDGRARREWQELQRPVPGREIPYALLTFEPFFFIPELEMLVQVFPYDHQLPSLPILMAGPPPTLEPLVLARFGEGDWRTEAWDVEPVRYRTGARMTLRLRVRPGIGRQASWKRGLLREGLPRGGRWGANLEVARKLWEKTEAGGESFSVGRPVAYLSDLRCLVQEEVPGSSLYDVFLREKDATPVARKAARALAALHLDEDVPRPRRPRPSKEDFDRRLMRIGAALRRACPIWSRRSRRSSAPWPPGRSRNPNRADPWRPPFTAYLPRRRPPRPDRPRRVRRGRSATGHRPHLIRPRRHASRFSSVPRSRAEGLTSLRRGILRTCSGVLARRVPNPLRSRRPEEGRQNIQDAEPDTGLARQGRSPDQGGQKLPGGTRSSIGARNGGISAAVRRDPTPFRVQSPSFSARKGVADGAMGHTPGRLVQEEELDHDDARPLQVRADGIRAQILPRRDDPAKVIVPASDHKPAVLVFAGPRYERPA